MPVKSGNVGLHSASSQTFAVDMKKISTILVTFFPILALAQEAEALTLLEPSVWQKIWWFLRLHIAWPSLALTIILISVWILLIPAKKWVKKIKTTYACVVILLFSIWYFYPCFTFKGTYSGTFYFKGGSDISVIIISDRYTTEEMNLHNANYTLRPFKRMLEVELPKDKPTLGLKYLPIYLGRNSIKQPVFWCGLVKHTKEE